MPAWMPGGGFHKTAATWRKTFKDTVELPFNYVKEQMVRPHCS
jgi:hypothetical protein